MHTRSRLQYHGFEIAQNRKDIFMIPFEMDIHAVNVRPAAIWQRFTQSQTSPKNMHAY